MKYLYRSKYLLALSFLFVISSLTAQDKSARLAKKTAELLSSDNNIAKIHMSEERETPYMIVFDQEKESAHEFAKAQNLIEQKLGIRKNIDEIRFDKSIPLRQLGLETQRFVQYHQGIKVEHGNYVATGKGEKLVAINGEYYELNGINVTPTLNETAALAQAVNWVGADSYAHDFIMEHFNGVYAPEIMSPWYAAYNEYYPTGELVIVDDYNTKDLDHNLAWKFNIYALSPRSRGEIYVNAHTGKVMLNDPVIKHWQSPGTAGSATVATRYADIQTIQTTMLTELNEPNPLFDETGGSAALTDSRSTNSAVLMNTPYLDPEAWVLIDQTKEAAGSTARIETYDVNAVGGTPISVPIYGQARSFTDDDNNWTAAEHVRGFMSSTNPAERQHDDDIAFDAHWGAGVVYDYWDEIHNRDSYDDNGAPIRSYVHIGNAFDNAFWNGSVMSYGDGQNFKSLTSLDVCGHEIGHAVCSSTSDLVYAKQSGGMNEGFSDIWAATTEYYQLLKQPALAYDASTNPDGMRPFGIGEQIETTGDDATGDKSLGALRWMDSPKVEGNPDTFGGDQWQETEDCEPSLANDQCGVHGNSGVLNKWFYLMTIGSGATPNSPDEQYAGAGDNEDDEMNDNAEAYAVTGLGFKIAEQIAFGAEVLLTPNGTFAECRLISILIAQTLSNLTVSSTNGEPDFSFSGGLCGDIEESVTNAWHGVGVGAAFSCNGLDELQAGFLGTDRQVTETALEDECDAVSFIFIDYFLNSTNTQSLIIEGTATEGKDYIIEQQSFNNPQGGYIPANFAIKIIDDALIEEQETIILKFANSNENFDTRTIIINDNDVAPEIGTSVLTIFSEDFEGNTPKFTIETPRVADGPNRWQIGLIASNTQTTNTSTIAYIADETANTSSDQYNGSLGNNDVYLISEQIDARGLTDVKVKFDWGAGGERDAGVNADEFDFGQLTYSFDGTTFFSVQDANFVGSGAASPLVVVTDTYEETLNFLDGKQFYIGFRWFNDPLVGNGPSFSVDNVEVTATPAQIETEMGEGKVARIDQGQQVFFLSHEDGGVIADISIENTDADLGCVDIEVAAAGTATTMFDQNSVRSEKIISAENSSTSPYTITLYYTAAEVQSFTDPMLVNIVKAVDIETMNGTLVNENTIQEAILDPSDDATIIGYKYTGTFTGFSEFALVSPGATSSLAVEFANLTATANQNNIQLDWATANEFDNKGFQIERQKTGSDVWENIGFTDGKGDTSTGHTYQYIDREVLAGVTYLYRLVQLDFNQSKSISNIVSAAISNQTASFTITPNPTVDHVLVQINTNLKETATISLLSVSGQVIQENIKFSGENNHRVDLTNYPSGIYFIKINTATGVSVKKIVKR
ncbi:MAG: M4 family metallopeptidase [Saprospiraceae bacterium]